MPKLCKRRLPPSTDPSNRFGFGRQTLRADYGGPTGLARAPAGSPGAGAPGNRLKAAVNLTGCGKTRPSFRDGPSGPGPESKNTGQAIDFTTPCSWISDSRAKPALRNDNLLVWWIGNAFHNTSAVIASPRVRAPRGPRINSAVAVGTGLAASPPRRSRRAAFPHRAPVSGDTVAPFGVWATHAVAQRDRDGAGDTPTRFCARSVPGRAVSPCPGAFPPSTPLPRARHCSQTSSVLRTGPTSPARASSATAPHLPDADRAAAAARSSRRPPRFRRDPFLRDVVFDPGRATAPRLAVPHVLPSTLLTASASASFEISWLNSTPHRIAVYALRPPSPTTPQHSLPGARYGLPGPVLHRLDRATPC